MIESLHISKFRNLEDIRIDKLKRMNLIVGRNGMGKTNILHWLAEQPGYPFIYMPDTIDSGGLQLCQLSNKIIDASEVSMITEVLQLIDPRIRSIDMEVFDYTDGLGLNVWFHFEDRSKRHIDNAGRGLYRLFVLALCALGASYRGEGIRLLIDNFEQGFHYTVQEPIWKWLFALAAERNMQIFATTHSLDCIESFSMVDDTRGGTEGFLFRLGRSVRISNRGQIIATDFDYENLWCRIREEMDVR